MEILNVHLQKVERFWLSWKGLQQTFSMDGNSLHSECLTLLESEVLPNWSEILCSFPSKELFKSKQNQNQKLKSKLANISKFYVNSHFCSIELFARGEKSLADNKYLNGFNLRLRDGRAKSKLIKFIYVSLLKLICLLDTRKMYVIAKGF